MLASASQASAAKITKPKWVKKVDITEYFPAPERWSTGKRVAIPGAGGARGRVDWLYSAWGMSMEGDGISLSGKRFHIDGLGSQGWVTKAGKKTVASQGFPQGSPYWRANGWRNRRGRVTFPLAGGGWAHGRPKRHIPPKGITFAPGPSRPLRYWRSIAVDPSFIPLGSRVYVPAYAKKPGGGCMKAVDVGAAIQGRHIDVYRKAPGKPGGGHSRYDRRIYVIPKGKRPPSKAPACLAR